MEGVTATYISTSKNRPPLEFLERSGPRCQEGGRFAWHTIIDYPMPQKIELISA